MDEATKRRQRSQTDEIDVSKVLIDLRPSIWKILAFSALVALAVLLATFFLPNWYRAEATISPATEEGNQNIALGALAASFGIPLGGASKVEDLEALFQSNDLTVRVFNKAPLWQYAYPQMFNMKTGKMRVGWLDRLLGEKAYRPPNDWDAIKAAEDQLNVYVNRRMGTLSVSYESSSPEGSEQIVRYYLEEAKSRLQEEALERARKNKKFIEDQIGKTVDALTRDRLYTMYGQEVEREMLARNREQFAFTLIDAPRVPIKKSWPPRLLIAFLAAFAAAVMMTIYFLTQRPREDGSLRARATAGGENSTSET